MPSKTIPCYYGSIELKVHTDDLLDASHDEHPYYWQIHAEAVLCTGEKRRTKVGGISFGVVLAGAAMDDGYDIIDQADAVDGDVYDFVATFYGQGKHGEAHRRWLEGNLEHWHEGVNALLVEHLWVEPKYRGRDIGVRMIKHVAMRYGSGCGLIALQAVPTVLVKPNEFGRDHSKESVEKLIRYYESIGFTRVPGSNWMVIDTAVSTPGRDVTQHDE